MNNSFYKNLQKGCNALDFEVWILYNDDMWKSING